MASTLTARGAEISMRALQLGASDYLAKPSSTRDIHGAGDFKQDLTAKVKALGAVARRQGAGARPGQRTNMPMPAPVPQPAPRTRSTAPIPLRPQEGVRPDVLAIGSSTGGPQALFQVLGDLRGGVAQPILITQHMPAIFTTILAEHIQRQCGIPCA